MVSIQVEESRSIAKESPDIRAHLAKAGMPLLVALMAILILPPVAYLIATSLFTTGPRGNFESFTFSNYLDLLGSESFLHSLLNTFIYASGSVVCAMIIGLAMAWMVERTNTPGRGLIILISIASLGTPHILHTIAWVLVLGRSGPVNGMLMALTGATEPVLNVYSLLGMTIIEGLVWVPLAYLMMSSIMRSADASLEEASIVSGGNIGDTFRRITLKLAIPALLALALLIFIRTVESFEVPAVVGLPGGISVLTTDIFEAASVEIPPNYGLASAFAVMLLVIVLALLQWYRRLLRHAERFQTITGKSYRPRVLDLGRWRYLTALILFSLVFIIILIPVLMMVWVSLVPFYDGIHLNAISRFTLGHFRNVLNSDNFYKATFDTISFGVGAAACVSILSVLCGWLIVRRRPGSWILDQLGMMPIVFPGIVLGIAFLQIFLRTPFGLYGTVLSLIIASTVHYLPYGMRYGTAGAMQLHKELEEVSAMSGASQGTTFRRIVLPLLMPTVITTSLLVFLLSVRGISMPIMLSGLDVNVAAVLLMDLYNNGQATQLAAMGLIWTAMMLCVSVTFYFFSRRYGLQVH